MLKLRRAADDNLPQFRGQFTGEASPPEEPLSLWYRRPATKWVEALAIGNGRLGAMVFGGVENERIQLNEDTLWAGGPYDPNNPEALAALPEARRLIFEGKYAEANRLIGEKMMAKPLRQMPYQTVGDLLLTFPEPKSVADYRRDLNLDTAVASVSIHGRRSKIHPRDFFQPGRSGHRRTAHGRQAGTNFLYRRHENAAESHRRRPNRRTRSLCAASTDRRKASKAR